MGLELMGSGKIGLGVLKIIPVVVDNTTVNQVGSFIRSLADFFLSGL